MVLLAAAAIVPALDGSLPPHDMLCPLGMAAWEFARHIQPGCGREVYDALAIATCANATPYTPPPPTAAVSPPPAADGLSAGIAAAVSRVVVGRDTAREMLMQLLHGGLVLADALQRQLNSAISEKSEADLAGFKINAALKARLSKHSSETKL